MVTIQVDEHTAERLRQQAQSAGLSINDYLRNLVPSAGESSRPSWDEIEQQFLDLSTSGPVLPADFSRADIYIDHD